MKKSLLFFFMLCILAVFPLFSQETVSVPEEQAVPAGIDTDDPLSENLPESETAQLPLFDDDTLFVISEFEFDIKGRSRPSALIYNGEFKTGEKIYGQTNLDNYIRDKTQMLINQRVLKDNALVTYSVGEQTEDGAYPVTLTLHVEDSWNIIALPRPAYSSNTGYDLTIKARDYNFLGTMNPLRVDVTYKRDEKGRNKFEFLVDSDTPFNALGYTWNLNFDNLFGYRPYVDEAFYYQNVTGLSMELPFHRTTFTFGFDEYFNLNEENLYRYQEFYGEDFQRGFYMTSKPYTLWKIPTGLITSNLGELTYTPGIAAKFNHELPDWPLLPFNKGPFLILSHLLGFEKIDWHANYRKGFLIFAENTYTWDFYRLDHNKAPLSISFTFNGTGHFIVSKFFGISSRLQYRHWYYQDPDYYELASEVLRGISDKAICADYMMSLNMDFPLRVLLFTPSQWFNSSKFRFFDFEFHVSPVVDMALFHDPRTNTAFHPKNVVATGGGEFIIFPSFMRNLYLRSGIAWNLREFVETKKLPGGDNREIYLIMGHFY